MPLKISHRARRLVAGLVFLVGTAVWLIINPASYEQEIVAETTQSAEIAETTTQPLAIDVLEKLEIKGRAPKTNYQRTQFYNGWPNVDGCSLRQRIIRRDLGDTAVLDGCTVVAGSFIEPYTGQEMIFTDKTQFAKKIQIDHIVALSDAWQKGAQNLTKDERYQIATDPLNLIAADGPANMEKGDGDAATWLPPNKAFRCEYVARQVSVKYRYHLWVTQAEYDAIANVLTSCPNEPAIVDN